MQIYELVILQLCPFCTRFEKVTKHVSDLTSSEEECQLTPNKIDIMLKSEELYISSCSYGAQRNTIILSSVCVLSF